MKALTEARAVYAFDFEYCGTDAGDIPAPVCLVLLELYSGRVQRFWRDELVTMKQAPGSVGDDAVWVCYYGAGDVACFLALGWSVPHFLVDLFVEFSSRTNGLRRPCGRGLAGAMRHYKLDAMTQQEKEGNRALVLQGAWTDLERGQVLNYCEADVRGTVQLLQVMRERNDLNLPTALLHGWYVEAVAHMETVGIPLDVHTHALLTERWTDVQDRLIARVDEQFHVYDGRSFREARFAQYLQDNGISWPRTPTGRLSLEADTFKDQCASYPTLEPLRQLRKTLAQMRLSDLPVGRDGRNRCMLSMFGTKTGRNAPSTSRFVFGAAAWLRSLVQPSLGMALAYVDWEQQEFGIGAALSGDSAMLSAYESGDPYLSLAKQCGAVPADATKETHPLERGRFKTLCLATQYLMGADAVAARLGVTPIAGAEYLALHRRTFRRFWNWSDGAVRYALMRGRLETVFGWPLLVTRETKERTLRNYPCQGNAAEMMRLACCYAVDDGVRIAAPVHDALLVEAPAAQIEEAVSVTRRAMARASVDVLRTMELRTDVKVVRHPERYRDPRGARMWDEVMGLLAAQEAAG